MALHSPQIKNALIHQKTTSQSNTSLAQALYAHFTRHRPWFNETVKLNERIPENSLTLREWDIPRVFNPLMACYSDHIYCKQPQKPRESKPLIAYWAQWYMGLLVPPLMLALLTWPQALNIHPDNIYVHFHKTGRAARFWLNVEEENDATVLPLYQRLQNLITIGLDPVVETLETRGAINSKLIWANTGYLINWFLGEITGLLHKEQIAELRHYCFFEKKFYSGEDNPLYRTVIAIDANLVRRTCCQRHKLPGMQCCNDCSLKKR